MERRKTKAEKGRQKKEDETWRHENSHFFGGVSLAYFNYKIVENLDF